MRPKKQPLKLSYGTEDGCCKSGSVWTRGDRGDGAAGGDDGEPAEPTEAGCLTKRSRRRRCRSRCELPLSSSVAAVAAAAAAPLESADSDEDGEGTDEASETASGDDETHCRHPDSVTEIKERMYLVKLACLKSQLSQLEQGVHPEYVRRLQQLEQQHKDRIHFASVWLQYECELIESECERDLCRLQSELQQRRVELRNSLIGELEHKRRQLDTERANMDINGDTIDVKQLPTRKLRRRANDPAPVQDKRRKCGGVAPPVFVLDDQLIDEDLLSISRNKPPPPPPPPPSTSSANTTAHHHHQQQQHHFRKSCFMPDSPMASFAITTTTTTAAVSATASSTASAAPSLTQSSATVTTVAHLSSSPIASPCSASTVATAVATTSSGVSSGATSAPTSGATGHVTNDVRIEDNKLFFERKWFHRGQPVFVEMSANDPSSSTFTTAATSSAAADGGGGGGGSSGGGSGSDGGEASQMSRYGAVITAIQAGVVWVRRTSDNTKTRISLDQLQHNQCSIKRRAS